MNSEVLLSALGIVGTLSGVFIGSILQTRAQQRWWRVEATRSAVVEFVRLAARLQLAVHEIAVAADGPGHVAAVHAMERALIELNVEMRAVELVTPWELSGHLWRNLGEIEEAVTSLRDPATVASWSREGVDAREGSPDVALWIQGCINDARRHLGYRYKEDFGPAM
jgi:hypothetical protein